jgi:hypothetical protein
MGLKLYGAADRRLFSGDGGKPLDYGPSKVRMFLLFLLTLFSDVIRRFWKGLLAHLRSNGEGLSRNNS